MSLLSVISRLLHRKNLFWKIKFLMPQSGSISLSDIKLIYIIIMIINLLYYYYLLIPCYFIKLISIFYSTLYYTEYLYKIYNILTKN